MHYLVAAVGWVCRPKQVRILLCSYWLSGPYFFQVTAGVNASSVKKMLFSIAMREKEKELRRYLDTEVLFYFDFYKHDNMFVE